MADKPPVTDCKSPLQSASISEWVNYYGSKTTVSTSEKRVRILGYIENKPNEPVVISTYKSDKSDEVSVQGPASGAAPDYKNDIKLAQKIREAAKAAVECGKFGLAEEAVNDANKLPRRPGPVPLR